MDENNTVDAMKITVEANARIALMCGVFGTIVGTGAYLLIKELTTRTLDDANLLVNERYIIELKNPT